MKENTHTTALAIFFITTAVVMITGLVVTVTQQAAYAEKRTKADLKYCFNESLAESTGTGFTCAFTKKQREDAREDSFLSPSSEPTSECYKLEEKGDLP